MAEEQTTEASYDENAAMDAPDADATGVTDAVADNVGIAVDGGMGGAGAGDVGVDAAACWGGEAVAEEGALAFPPEDADGDGATIASHPKANASGGGIGMGRGHAENAVHGLGTCRAQNPRRWRYSWIVRWVTMRGVEGRKDRCWGLLEDGATAADGEVDGERPCGRRGRSWMGGLQEPALDVPTLLTSWALAHWVLWAEEVVLESVMMGPTKYALCALTLSMAPLAMSFYERLLCCFVCCAFPVVIIELYLLFFNDLVTTKPIDTVLLLLFPFSTPSDLFDGLFHWQHWFQMYVSE